MQDLDDLNAKVLRAFDQTRAARTASVRYRRTERGSQAAAQPNDGAAAKLLSAVTSSLVNLDGDGQIDFESGLCLVRFGSYRMLVSRSIVWSGGENRSWRATRSSAEMMNAGGPWKLVDFAESLVGQFATPGITSDADEGFVASWSDSSTDDRLVVTIDNQLRVAGIELDSASVPGVVKLDLSMFGEPGPLAPPEPGEVHAGLATRLARALGVDR